MHSLGIVKLHDRILWALVRKDKNIAIEHVGEGDVDSNKNCTVVTGLEGTSVIRRDLKLPLKTTRTIRAALPFQLEPLLPFPLDQSVVFPQLHPTKNETVVVAWAASKPSIDSHLESYADIDPDFVSSQTLALARWARHFYPDEHQMVVVHGTIGIALDRDVVVCAMESQDPARLKLFLNQKYPLYTWIESGPSWEYAIPIGLALEAFQKIPCQFRAKDSSSLRQKKRERHLLKTTFIAGAALILATALFSEGVFRYKENKLRNQIGNESVENFRFNLIKESKSLPPIYNFPASKDVLAWLSTISTPVEIAHIEYELEGNRGQVSIEFQAASQSDADLFVKQLQHAPTYVESTQELKWNLLPQGYKISFPLRKSS